MAENRNKAPDEGPKGVDRWTSNGYGIRINGKKVEPVETEEKADKEVDDIEEV